MNTDFPRIYKTLLIKNKKTEQTKKISPLSDWNLNNMYILNTFYYSESFALSFGFKISRRKYNTLKTKEIFFIE